MNDTSTAARQPQRMDAPVTNLRVVRASDESVMLHVHFRDGLRFAITFSVGEPMRVEDLP